MLSGDFEMELNNELLLAVPIKDNEIFELLERLAATEEMFKTPVSTIRDVAELTDASPNLIARLLGEIRGSGELGAIIKRLDDHETRIRTAESIANQTSQTKTAQTSKHSPKSSESAEHRLDADWKPFEKRIQLVKDEDILDKWERIPLKAKYAVIIIVSLIILVLFSMVGFQLEKPSLPPPYETR